MTLSLRYAARSDRGLLREGNEDSLYAGPRLLVVADGMGGHAAGEVASAIAVARLSPLDDDAPGADLHSALRTAVFSANDELRNRVRASAELEGMGTTVTALLFAGSRIGLLHIGDSRAYLVRDGVLTQITEDHTLVQSLVNEGRITADEANHHPQRNLVMRALDGRTEIEPDVSVREARVGDRYLLCSDGLSGVVSDETMLREALELPDLSAAVDRLVDLALRGGGPDNISVVLAEVVEGGGDTTPVVDGAAAEGRDEDEPPTTSAAGRAARTQARPEPRPQPVAPSAPPPPRRRGRAIALGVVSLMVLILGATVAWAYVQSQYFVGVDDERVTIFRGVDGSLAGVALSSVQQQTDILVAALPAYQRDRVEDGIAADDREHAERIADQLREQARYCPPATAAPTTAPTAAATPGATATATPTPTPTPTPTTSCVPEPT